MERNPASQREMIKNGAVGWGREEEEADQKKGKWQEQSDNGNLWLMGSFYSN